MNIEIAILDYGVGNLCSLARAFDRHPLGQLSIKVTANPRDLRRCDLLVLPGVGSFHQAMANIEKQRLIDLLNELALTAKKPTLGICLGMQLFFEHSFEGGCQNGLGWMQGRVTRLPIHENYKVPQIGWNRVVTSRTFLKSSLHNVPFYFVHSYRVECSDQFVLGTAEYGDQVVAAVKHENLLGFQFHPEKSGCHGQNLIAETVNWAIRSREGIS